MPANVVKTPADEKHWESAKAQAEKEGKKGDWAYVMSIYLHMSGQAGKGKKK